MFVDPQSTTGGCLDHKPSRNNQEESKFLFVKHPAFA